MSRPYLEGLETGFRSLPRIEPENPAQRARDLRGFSVGARRAFATEGPGGCAYNADAFASLDATSSLRVSGRTTRACSAKLKIHVCSSRHRRTRSMTRTVPSSSLVTC